jgi:protein AbiQ
MVQSNTLYFHTLKQSFYQKYKNYDEFQEDPNRGHGIMIYKTGNLIVAIPLRSKLKPNTSRHPNIMPYKTYICSDDGREYLAGMDLSKLLIIEEDCIDTTNNFIFRDENEKAFYFKSFNRIHTKLTNYIEKYIRICSDIKNGNALTEMILRPYRFSTLRNFHSELGIELDKDTFIIELQKYFK